MKTKKLIFVVLATAIISMLCSMLIAGHFPFLSGDRYDSRARDHARTLFEEGKEAFRYDTFGDEAFWGDALKLHQAIAGEANGGVGPGLTPIAALNLGLKVDLEALPPDLIGALERGEVDLNDPATTLALLQLDAVVGVKGNFSGAQLASVGIQCALCHSTVDDAFTTGIGARLDGWANRDLDVGTIISLAPDLSPLTGLLQVDEATVKAVLTSWGPGKFDASLLMDGKAFRPDGKSAATLIPPAFGLAGVNLHTYEGWGSITHWNAFVSQLEMGGRGTFYDPRLNDPVKFPIAAANGFGNVRNSPDLVTPKLAALQFYQLALPAPPAPRGSYDRSAATAGQAIFAGKAECATCHVPPIFTEPGWNMHTPDEIGIDDFQANRGPDGAYRTTPLKGLWTHQKGGFYHDGRFATLAEVIDHYDQHFGLGLTSQEKYDLGEYLKSLGEGNESGHSLGGGNKQAAVAESFALHGNYPNPFNPETMIKFELNEAGKVRLQVFNVTGQLVRLLVNENAESGAHQILWDGKNDRGQQVASGTYFYRLEMNGRAVARKMTLMK